jgi:four helix bundle protein
MEYIELNVWIKNRELSNSIYTITKKYPKDELYGIVMQMRRAAVSIVSNIAEGCGRNHKNDSIQFFHIARGSLYELETQCYISYDQGFVNNLDLDKILIQIAECKKLLNGFINYYKKSKTN